MGTHDFRSSQVNILNGATWIFQLAGLGAITSLGNFQIWTILRCYPGFQDPYSPDFVQSPGSCDHVR